MSELGPRAREILHSGRELNRPTAADRERIDSALRERLGAALLLDESGKELSTPHPRWPFLTKVVIGVGLLGGGLFLTNRHPHSGSVETPVAAPATLAASAASPESRAVELAPPAEPAKTPSIIVTDHPAPSVRPAEDRLAQEVALLARATSSLHAGRPVDALKVLDEYQRRFPKGKLTEERRSARAQALCALGRQSEAQAELARLAPQSIAAARAQQVCDASSAH